MEKYTNILPLLSKYDVPIPRYTSYPTVPYWEPQSLTTKNWLSAVVNTFTNEQGHLSLYIHLPFCENLCTFCACNKRITKNHAVETPYLEAVLKEWQMYRSALPSEPVIQEIHLGGGTPTFFSPQNLVHLVTQITRGAQIAPNHEFSVEVHPNYTTEAHLQQLAAAGFNRISLGVQDFDPTVQFIINRIQTFEKTAEVVNWARKYGYHSINIDLVYGLPKQTTQSVAYTIDKINRLKPHRIAFYSYAHVPWKSKVQRRYTDDDLPKAAQKWQMYQLGRNLLLQNGFTAIGMDHFALPTDPLFTAAQQGNMHRNFMGYTTTQNKLIIGLGASSISDAWTAFAQNEKDVAAYQTAVEQGTLPIVTGHLLTPQDLAIRRLILDLMCRSSAVIDPNLFPPGMFTHIQQQLNLLQTDALVNLQNNTLTVTPQGQLFIRNICAVFDVRLWQKQPQGVLFSKSI